MQIKNLLFSTSTSNRLPNSDINVTAFKKMAAIVGAFTRHISEISTTPETNEFDYLINHILSCPLRSEHGEQQLRVISIVLKLIKLLLSLQSFSAHWNVKHQKLKAIMKANKLLSY